MALNNPMPRLRDEYLKRKRNRRLLQYGVSLLFVAVVIGVFSYIVRRPEITISKIELSGGTLVTQEEVSALSLEYLKGSYLLIFPVRNAFWYPKSQLEKYLKESFKRIDTINIERKDFHTLQIDITEKKPFALWCNSSAGTQASESEASAEASMPKCYFMDDNSIIFAEAPVFSGDAYFKYYGMLDGTDPIGKYYFASSSQFADIVDLVSVARKLSLRPQYLIAKGDDEFSLVISGGGEIYFDTKKPLQDVIENLEALLRTSVLATSTTRDLPIEYIDLRFGNKLFYKLKN